MISQPLYDSMDNDTLASSKKEDLKELSREYPCETYSDDFDKTSIADENDAEGGGKADSLRSIGILNEEVNDKVDKTDYVNQTNLEIDSHSKTDRSSSSSSSISREREKLSHTNIDDRISHTSLEKSEKGRETLHSPVLELSSSSKPGDDSSQTAEMIEKLMNRLGKKSHAIKSRDSQAVTATTYPSEKLENDGEYVDFNCVMSVVNTREELANLLAQNDELRAKLLENRRVAKHSTTRHKNTSCNNSRLSQSPRQYHRTTMAIQKAMQREEIRQDLCGEREHLIELRDGLRKTIATNKRLRSYLPLIEECKSEILKLVEEKRALLLAIRQNEKILITNREEQESENTIRRLKEEIRADAVLTQRALQKAQQDAFVAVKMRQDAEVRLQKLKEQLSEVENTTQPTDMEPESRRLYYELQQKAQIIKQLREELRGLKSGSFNETHKGKKERSKKSVKKEKEKLIKHILDMRRKIQELSTKKTENNLAANRKSNIDTTANKTDPTVPSTVTAAAMPRRSSSEKQKLDISADGGRQWCDSEPNKLSDMALERNNKDAIDTSGNMKNKEEAEVAMRILESQVEQKRVHHDMETKQESITTLSIPPTVNAMAYNASLEEPQGSYEEITQPIFLKDEEELIPEIETNAAIELEPKEEEEEGFKKKDDAVIPPWIKEDDINSSPLESQKNNTKPDYNVADENESDDVGLINESLDGAQENTEGEVDPDINTNASGEPLPELSAFTETAPGVEMKKTLEEKAQAELMQEEVDTKVEFNKEADVDMDANVNLDADNPVSSEPAGEPAWLDFD